MTGTLFYLLCSIASISAGVPAISRSFTECPPVHTIRPCICRSILVIGTNGVWTYDDVVIYCEKVIYDVYSLKALIGGMAILKDSEPKRLALKNVFLRYLPEDLFEGTNLESLFLLNSRISSLSEGEHPLKGLENVLVNFHVYNCTDVNRWDLTQLKRLKKLKYLGIKSSNLQELSEDFLDIASQWNLLSFSFYVNNIEELPPKAFSKFRELRKLIMGYNSLKSLRRSELPNPATELTYLMLSNNKLRYLPSDLFTGMPKLKVVYLEENPIKVLEEQTFKPVWNHTTHLRLGYKFHCDCRMAWITWVPRTNFVQLDAACETPERLRGKNSADLKIEDFEC